MMKTRGLKCRALLWKRDFASMLVFRQLFDPTSST